MSTDTELLRALTRLRGLSKDTRKDLLELLVQKLRPHFAAMPPHLLAETVELLVPNPATNLVPHRCGISALKQPREPYVRSLLTRRPCRRITIPLDVLGEIAKEAKKRAQQVTCIKYFTGQPVSR